MIIADATLFCGNFFLWKISFYKINRTCSVSDTICFLSLHTTVQFATLEARSIVRVISELKDV